MTGRGQEGVADYGLGWDRFAKELTVNAFPVAELEPPGDAAVGPGLDHIDHVPLDATPGGLDAEERADVGGADTAADDEGVVGLDDVLHVEMEVGEG